MNRGLVAFRRRLSEYLGVGELVHRVLHRSRGGGDDSAPWNAAMLKTLTERGPWTFWRALPQSAASIVSVVNTPLKAAHVVTRSDASPFVALASMFSAKPSARPRISWIFAIVLPVLICESCGASSRAR